MVGSAPAVGDFFDWWTRKEAFIKVVGEGLSYPLDTFEVTFLQNETVEFRLNAPATRRRVPHSLTVPEGYSAAYVVGRPTPEGAVRTISRWRWGQSQFAT